MSNKLRHGKFGKRRSTKLLPVLLCLVLAGCAAPGARQQTYTPAKETPWTKAAKAMGEASRAGNFAEAEQQAKAMLALAGPFDLGGIESGIAFSALVGVYLRQRKFEQAERLHRQAIDFLGTLGLYDKRAQHARFNIANLGHQFLFAGRHTEAGNLYRRNLEYTEKAAGPVHLNVAHGLNHLAGFHEKQASYAEAENLYRRALAIRKKLHGPDHGDIVHSFDRLTRLYRRQDRHAEADAFQAQALAVLARLGPNTLREAHVLTYGGIFGGGGVALRRTGRYIESETHLIRALRLREKIRGPEHADVARSLNELGLLYKAQGRYGKAERIYKRARKIAEKTPGPDHPTLARILDNLASLYQAQKRYGEAEPLIRRSLAIFEKALGQEHRDVAIVLNNLAYLYRSQERYAQAEPIFRRSLSINRKLFGPDHPTIGRGLGNLAMLYQAQGKFAAAEQLYKRALAIAEKSWASRVNLAVNLNNLADLYTEQGRYSLAEPLFQRALLIFEDFLNPRHPLIADSLVQYAGLMRATGRLPEAEKLEARAKEIRARNKN